MIRKPVRKFKETLDIRSSILVRVRSHRYFPVSLLITVFLMASVIHIWQRVRVLELVREVSELRTHKAVLADDATRLNAQIAALSLAGRVETYARDTLGLVPLSAERLFSLVRKDKVREMDDLTVVLQAIERVTEHMPVISETRAAAGELPRVRIDSAHVGTTQ